ncbi:MAG TPA: ATP-binding protein [Candidatus Gallacutalibacter pullistercoris]|nr:ATP-binding protein [Candidatus Gallacutalibacter pullistercoris]
MRELSLNVMDVTQNSITAGASFIEIRVEEDRTKSELVISIIDNGKGMSAEQVRQVIDPFYTTRTTRKVGLGVPLFKMEAEMTGGDFSIQSKLGEGTTVQARFITSHVDMIPLGNIDNTVLLLISCNPDRDFLFVHQVDEKKLELDTRQLREILGEDVPLNSPDVVQWMQAYLQEQTDLLQGGEST